MSDSIVPASLLSGGKARPPHEHRVLRTQSMQSDLEHPSVQRPAEAQPIRLEPLVVESI